VIHSEQIKGIFIQIGFEIRKFLAVMYMALPCAN